MLCHIKGMSVLMSGGRTLLALAAKGRRLPVMTSEDFAKVGQEIAISGAVLDDT
jgi:hypothetical protein